MLSQIIQKHNAREQKFVSDPFKIFVRILISINPGTVEKEEGMNAREIDENVEVGEKPGKLS